MWLATSDLSSGMMGDMAGNTGDGGLRSKFIRVECSITLTRGDSLSSLSSLLNHSKISSVWVSNQSYISRGPMRAYLAL